MAVRPVLKLVSSKHGVLYFGLGKLVRLPEWLFSELTLDATLTLTPLKLKGPHVFEDYPSTEVALQQAYRFLQGCLFLSAARPFPNRSIN